MVNAEEINRKIASVPSWWHSIEVAPGIVTPGRCSQARLQAMVDAMDLPPDLTGCRVLDIGAWDGYMSFEVERKGATVVALDLSPADHFGFAVAKELLCSQVKYVQGNVYDLDEYALGKFDIVLFCGVLYHLRHPLLALDKIYEHVAGDRLIVETHVAPDPPKEPCSACLQAYLHKFTSHQP